MKLSIKYPKTLSWTTDLRGQNDPFLIFGPRLRKVLRKSQKQAEVNNIQFVIEPVSHQKIQSFQKIYEDNLTSKSNPHVYDIEKYIFTNPKHNYPYHMLNIYVESRLWGGLIFSKRQDHLAGAFRAIPKITNLQGIDLNLLADFFIAKYAIEQSMSYIRKGRDRNLYGQNASIGLANYKAKVGNYPCLVPDLELEDIKLEYDWDERSSVLIFLAPDHVVPMNTISEALLLCRDSDTLAEIRKKYGQIFECPYFKLRVVLALDLHLVEV